jgi:predicted RecB family nuclease
MGDRHSSQNWTIRDLPGLSSQDQQQLEAAGIRTTLDLLRCTQTRSQQQALATQLQIHPQRLQKWIALADLARVPGVGCQYCGLLLHAGIRTPTQLSTALVPRLHRQILKLYVSMLQRRDLCPSAGTIAQWVQQAQQMTP